MKDVSRFLIEVRRERATMRVLRGREEIAADGTRVVHCGWGPHPGTERLAGIASRHSDAVIEGLEGPFFVFAWDPRCRVATYASDRLGGVPVFVYEDRERLILSDHCSGILALGIETEPHLPAILDFFTFFWVLGEGTFLRPIRRLEPATIVRGGRSRRYWHYDQPGGLVEEAVASHEIRERVEAAVGRRLGLLEEGLAAHLSGGVDSSVLCLLLGKYAPGQFETLSLRTAGDRNETPWIEEVRGRIDATHRWVESPGEDLLDSLDEVIAAIGEPSGYPSVLSRYRLERGTETRHVLVGRGVDELFSGYSWHLPPHLQQHLARRRVFGREAVLRLVPGLRDCHHEPEAVYQEIYDRCREDGALERSLHMDVSVLLRSWLEIEYQIAGACGHTCHTPVLDRDVVDLASAMSPALKVRGGLKGGFKAAFRDLLPASVLERPKMGLHLPMSRELRGPLGEQVFARWQELRADDHPELDLPAIRDLLAAHRAGRGELGWQVWALLCYLSWKRLVSSGSPRPGRNRERGDPR